MRYETNMTVKGQITVPKDIRDALGLKPGQKVGIELDDDGNARIVKVDREAEREAWLQRVKEARAKYKPLPDYAHLSPLEFQRLMRGDGPEV